MPYKLRKAPGRDLYWVVGVDGKHKSKNPLPKERASAQMRALYAYENTKLKGGATRDERGMASYLRELYYYQSETSGKPSYALYRYLSQVVHSPDVDAMPPSEFSPIVKALDENEAVRELAKIVLAKGWQWLVIPSQYWQGQRGNPPQGFTADWGRTATPYWQKLAGAPVAMPRAQISAEELAELNKPQEQPRRRLNPAVAEFQLPPQARPVGLPEAPVREAEAPAPSVWTDARGRALAEQPEELERDALGRPLGAPEEEEEEEVALPEEEVLPLSLASETPALPEEEEAPAPAPAPAPVEDKKAQKKLAKNIEGWIKTVKKFASDHDKLVEDYVAVVRKRAGNDKKWEDFYDDYIDIRHDYALAIKKMEKLKAERAEIGKRNQMAKLIQGTIDKADPEQKARLEKKHPAEERLRQADRLLLDLAILDEKADRVHTEGKAYGQQLNKADEYKKRLVAERDSLNAQITEFGELRGKQKAEWQGFMKSAEMPDDEVMDSTKRGKELSALILKTGDDIFSDLYAGEIPALRTVKEIEQSVKATKPSDDEDEDSDYRFQLEKEGSGLHTLLKGAGLERLIGGRTWTEYIVQKVGDVAQGIRKGYSPSSRRTLQTYGNLKIVKAVARRAPIQSAIHSALNLLTAGQWNKARAETNQDKLFHLGIVLTLEGGKHIIVEKNEVVNVGTTQPVVGGSEMVSLPTPRNTTLSQFLEKGEKAWGADKYFKYDAFSNNCQDFVAHLLTVNGMYPPYAKKFVKQPVDNLLSKLPSWTQKVAKIATDVAGLANVAIEGRGLAERPPPSNPEVRVSGKLAEQLKKAELSPSSYLDEARRRAKSHGYPYKLLGFSDDGVHKLAIPNQEGKMIRFGRVGYGDHIIWSALEQSHKAPSGKASQKRETFHKSHSKIKGRWREDSFSPNNLALKILW